MIVVAMGMSEQWLSNFEWQAIAPLLPHASRGIPRVDDRRVIGGILWVLRNRRTWRELPAEFGPRTTCYNRYVRWRRSGIWDLLMQAIEMPRKDATVVADPGTPLGSIDGETTSTRILRTALRLFALGGFDGVSTRKIATAAAVPPASLRYYFKSKKGLYEACLAYIHNLSSNLTDAALCSAERSLLNAEVSVEQLIDAYCDLQDSYVDVLIGSDDGMIALFVVRNDLLSENGVAPAHTDDPLGARIFDCHVRLIGQLSGDALDVGDAAFIWIMIHGQLITLCMSRPRLEIGMGSFKIEQVRKIKHMVRRQTGAVLREYAYGR